jgi:hypothetical protein
VPLIADAVVVAEIRRRKLPTGGYGECVRCQRIRPQLASSWGDGQTDFNETSERDSPSTSDSLFGDDVTRYPTGDSAWKVQQAAGTRRSTSTGGEEGTRRDPFAFLLQQTSFLLSQGLELELEGLL